MNSLVWNLLCFAFLSIGLVVIFISADGLMDNLRWIADKYRIHPVILGVIILGMDPGEFIVSIVSASKGLKYLAIGNVIGNTFIANTLCFSLPFLFFPQSFLNELSNKLKSDDRMKIPTFYFVLIVISAAFIGLNGILIVNRFEYNLLFLAMVNLIIFIIYICKNYYAYIRNEAVDIYIEPSSDSSSSSSSSKSALNVQEYTNNYGAVTDAQNHDFKKKKLKKSLFVICYLILLIFAGELCVYSAKQMIANIHWLNQSIFGYLILSFVTNAEEIIYTINAFRKNNTSSYGLGIGAMIGKLFFNLTLIYGICGLILQRIWFRDIDVVNTLMMIISTVYLSVVLANFHFYRIHGFILFGSFIAYCVINLHLSYDYP